MDSKQAEHHHKRQNVRSIINTLMTTNYWTYRKTSINTIDKTARINSCLHGEILLQVNREDHSIIRKEKHTKNNTKKYIMAFKQFLNVCGWN